jgi:hypothetical protein
MLQQQNHDIDLQLNQTKINIENTNKSKTTYEEIADKIEQLVIDTSNGANNLRMYIEDRSKLYDDYINNSSQQNETATPAAPTAQIGGPSISDELEVPGHPNCTDFLGGTSAPNPKDNWMNCNVLEHIKDQFNNYNNLLSENIPSLLKKVNDTSVSPHIHNMSRDVEKLRNEFSTSVSKQISEDPTFWTQYTEKSEFYDNLNTKVHEFWNEYHNIGMILSTKITDLTDVRMKFEDQKNTTENNKEELANRLNGMEFPFGRIPIGPNESVAVFPIAIAVGFSIVCYFLGNTIQLRKALHEWYKNMDPNSQDLKKKIPYIAPLWIDPTHSINNKIIRLAILMVPFAIFISSWYLISYGWDKILYEDMRTTFPYNEELYKQFYQGLYIFSLIFFGYGIFTIVTKWYSYNI